MIAKKLVAITMAVLMLLSVLAILNLPTAKAAETYQIIKVWGTEGFGEG